MRKLPAVTINLIPGFGQKVISGLCRESLPPHTVNELFRWLPSPSPGFSVDLNGVRRAWAEAERLLDRAERGEFSIVVEGESGFPSSLAEIKEPSALLYVKSKLETPFASWSNENAWAVIGCRAPSPYAVDEGIKRAADLTARGKVVVSGLALGCDTAAHIGALEGAFSAGRGVLPTTVAVLPSGFDHIYPDRNSPLAERIVEEGGVLLSEYPPSTEAGREWRFIKRDRLQSGLVGHVLVIETDISGGTLHTVNFARADGRKVYVLNSHSGERRNYRTFRGNSMLLEQKWTIPVD